MTLCICKSFPSLPSLFENPLGREESCTVKIISIAFHIFTLGIPYLLSKICPFEFSKKIVTPIYRVSSSDLTGLSETGRSALELVNNLLRVKHPNIEELLIHKERTLVSTLLALLKFENNQLNRLLKKYPDLPWSEKEVKECQNNMMAVAFILTMLSLKDISHAISLICLKVYCYIRSGPRYISNTDKIIFDQYEGRHPDDFFYNSQMPQFKWRALYNECFDTLGSNECVDTDGSRTTYKKDEWERKFSPPLVHLSFE